MSRLAVKEFTKAKAQNPFEEASKEPLPQATADVGPAVMAPAVQEANSESDSEEEDGLVWQAGGSVQGKGERTSSPNQQQAAKLDRCMSSIRDYFTLGPIDQLLLSIVVFGASGDLAKKKTYPALFALYSKGFLPAGLQILGYARSPMTNDQLRQRIAEYLPGPGKSGHQHVQPFLEHCCYVSGEYDKPAGYEALSGKLCGWEQRLVSALPACGLDPTQPCTIPARTPAGPKAPPAASSSSGAGDGAGEEAPTAHSGVAANSHVPRNSITIGRLFYMALPPSVYPSVTPLLAQHCGTVPLYGGEQKSGKTATGRASMDTSSPPAATAALSSQAPWSTRGSAGGAGQGGVSGSGRQWWVRMILEKPFGSDIDSSEALAEVIGRDWPEEKLYRIDHYLGKELVQNMLVLRFANGLFGAFWNRHHIDNVQITFKEPFGTQGRGGYFDQYGIIRDVIQNHLMQVLSLLTMEAPVSMHPDDIRDEKVKLLRCVRSPSLEDCVLGQYTAAEGNPGYLDDSTVPAGSRTPTFAAIKLQIANDRWAGVPFVIKAGKALNERVASVRIQLRTPAASIFGDLSHMRNELVIRFQPAEAIYAKVVVKRPGLDMVEEMSELDLTYPERYKDVIIPDAYERLILDCIRGDAQHFVRRDELRAAWAILTPVLRAIDSGAAPIEPYPYGSRGPATLDAFMAASGFVKTQYAWRPHGEGLRASGSGKAPMGKL